MSSKLLNRCIIGTVVLLISINSYPVFSQIHFKQYGIENGLPHPWVRDMAQDNEGFMWLATADGLVKFDGKNFNTFKPISGDSTSLQSNSVWTVEIDANNTVWVGLSGGGLARYNRQLDNFKTYLHDPKNEKSIPNDQIYKLLIDKTGSIWIAFQDYYSLTKFNPITEEFTTINDQDHAAKESNQISIDALYEDINDNIWIGHRSGGGLTVYNPKTNYLRHYKGAVNNKNGMMEAHFRSICGDSLGNIWAGTRNGLYHKSPESDEFEYISHNPSNRNSMSENTILSLLIKNKNEIWIGHENTGLSIYDPEKNTFERIYPSPYDPQGLSHSSIHTIQCDADSNIWIGTFGSGINIYKHSPSAFQFYSPIPDDPTSLSNKIVTSLVEDEDENIWISTDGGGINHFHPKENVFAHYYSLSTKKEDVNCKVSLDLHLDRLGYLWVGTFNHGLNYLNVHTNEVGHIPDSLLKGKHFSCLKEDNQGKLWAGTWDGYVNIFNREDSVWEYKFHDPLDTNSIEKGDIHNFYSDKNGDMWVATSTGLCKYDNKKDYFISYTRDEDHLKRIPSGNINGFLEDSKNRFWVATIKGLYQINRKTGIIVQHYTTEDGLTNNVLHSIVEDNFGYLWISTNRGVCRFHPDRKTFQNYTNEDGLHSISYRANSFVKRKNGDIIFGGNRGFDVIKPYLVTNNQNLSTRFTNLLLLNETVLPSEESSVLTSHISQAQKITLNHDQSVFTLKYTTINFFNPDKVRYRYRLIGFDKDWIDAGTSTSATYTNMDPGQYVFQVASSVDNVHWNESSKIQIIITPAFWMTWWFKSFALLFLATLIFWRVRKSLLRAQMTNRMLEEKVLLRTKQITEQNGHITDQNDQISIKNQKLEIQKNLINEQKNAIQEGILVGKRVQQSALPHVRDLTHLFSDAFIINIPKDHVSGDFHWWQKIGDYLFIACADCTGHGVAGGMLTMIGINALNNIVSSRPPDQLQPSEILTQLNQDIQQMLKQDYDTMRMSGMDISILRYHIKTKVATISSAMSPIYIIESKSKTFKRIAATRRSIGKMSYKAKSTFEDIEIQFNEGDRIIMMSDGYIDQLKMEGQKVDRFQSRRFKDVLKENISEPLSHFEKSLLVKHGKWKGDNIEQTDDILIIGIEV